MSHPEPIPPEPSALTDGEPLVAFLRALGQWSGAGAVQFTPTAGDETVGRWIADGGASEGGTSFDGDAVTAHARAWLHACGRHRAERRAEVTAVQGVRVLIARVGADTRTRGALTVVAPSASQWGDDRTAPADLADLAAALCGTVVEAAQNIPTQHQRHLDELVTTVATRLMPASASTIADAYHWTVKTLRDFFSVDVCFLRRNDHERGVSVLVAEWPDRPDAPDPDPLIEVPFDGSDPVFAAIRDLSAPLVIRPDAETKDYQRRVQQSTGLEAVSLAMVPLLYNERTEGALGFVKFGDRSWSTNELGALQAIGSLLAQLLARIDAEERLSWNANHDQLTALPNRRAFLERLHGLLQPGDGPGEGSPVALFFLDLDRLKAMNDFLGHGAGDQFLFAIATRLRNLIGPADFAARLGGDEFVILAPGLGDMNEAMRVGRGMLEQVTIPIDIGGHPISRTASIGVAIGHPGQTSVDELIQYADIALLEAKARGKSAVQPFNEEMRAKMDYRSEIELHLSSAIATGAFHLHYQPEFDLRNGALVAVEALLRWNHPARGLLMAEQFIDIAEETNTIIELGRWVLGEACAQLARWRDAYPQLKLLLRVNVSPAQLISKDMVPDVAATLASTGLPGDALCLEITEREVLPDLDQVLAALRELHEIGVRCAIDDFGTGYSSLAQLKSLPVDTVKIERGFVRGVGSDPGDTAIVESIVRLAHTFRLGLVAEGVESRSTARELVRIGCHYAQGNLLGVPMPPETLEPWLASGHWALGTLVAT